MKTDFSKDPDVNGNYVWLTVYKARKLKALLENFDNADVNDKKFFDAFSNCIPLLRHIVHTVLAKEEE